MFLKIIDENGEEVWSDKFKFGYVHLDSFRKFANSKNLNISLSTDETAALSLASISYISILNVKVGYGFYLPELCSEKQIEYLEKHLPFFKEEENEGKIVDVDIYSKEKVYYNHQNYRDLKTEEKIDILERKKNGESLVTELLDEELKRQKEIIESKKK